MAPRNVENSYRGSILFQNDKMGFLKQLKGDWETQLLGWGVGGGREGEKEREREREKRGERSI